MLVSSYVRTYEVSTLWWWTSLLDGDVCPASRFANFFFSFFAELLGMEACHARTFNRSAWKTLVGIEWTDQEDLVDFVGELSLGFFELCVLLDFVFFDAGEEHTAVAVEQAFELLVVLLCHCTEGEELHLPHLDLLLSQMNDENEALLDAGAVGDCLELFVEELGFGPPVDSP